MLTPGPAKKITIYLNEDTSSESDYLSQEILGLLLQQGIAGASVLRPEAGFGAHHRVHTQKDGIDADRHRPLRIEFIDTAAKVEAVLPLLRELMTDGLIEGQDIVILHVAVGKAG